MFWFAIMIIALGAFYFDFEKIKLKKNDGKELQRQIGHLMAENESLKERMKNIEELLGNSKDKIDLEYEKEQIRIDKQNKF